VWDELDEPLGFPSGAAAALPVRRKRQTQGAAIGAAILAIVVGLLTLPRRDLALNGEPFVVAKIEVLPAPQRAAAPETTASVRQTPAPPLAPAEQTEGTSGVKVTRGSGGPSKPLIIDVAQALGVKLAPAPDPRLIEKSKYGLLPRIGADGARPIDVYARATVSDSVLRASGPRIALVVGGFGLTAEGAESAIIKLPGAITLAFAPTGAAVEQQAAQARAAGHETVLQARLDDFSHPANDFGTHAPDTSASDVKNLDTLRWQMGRFTGYVAVVNDSGGKFMVDRQSMPTLLQEIADRGLGYLDDDAPPGSVGQEPTAMLPMPSARADLAIDANAAPETLDASLARLVGLARQRGSAIGVVSGAPADIARLERWANGLDSKGVALVPLSALMSATPNPSAQSNLSHHP
jgi:polysaccharide deacetylase 2 family uncharacterized protein YibQ